ncbi:MAG: endolytic transglycosylase MltG [Burkholderiales bacterium]
MSRPRSQAVKLSGRNRAPAGLVRPRTLALLIILGIAGVAVTAGWLMHFAFTSVHVPVQSRSFNVEQGMGLRQIATRLESTGVVSDSRGFILLARLLGKAGHLKAGSYEVDQSIAPISLLNKLERGEFAQGQVRFIEGWTFRQIRDALYAHPMVRNDTKGFDDREILERLGAPEIHPEGLFFPDTYHFSAGTSDLVILQHAYWKMQSVLVELWESRASGLPLSSPYEALVLASIVEKETGHPEERELVAAVFINRLKRGMRLQADPTIVYGLGEDFEGRLRTRHLQADQPYNTYTRAGLPPTPIALPGAAAIAATLNPADSPALYFVSRNDGTHVFSRTLQEHNRAVYKYQKSQ